MRMLGTDVHTQQEFDEFKASEFDPVKQQAAAAAAKIADLEKQLSRLKRQCYAFAGGVVASAALGIILRAFL